MPETPDTVRRYKWNASTLSGYKLRFDAEGAAQGSERCFYVEDWCYRAVTNQWPCRDLDEALGVLGDLFAIDINQEREQLSGWLPREQCSA